MRTQVSWTLALTALLMSGSLAAGCKSSKDGRKPVDGGQDGSVAIEDGGVIVNEGGAVVPGTPGFSLSRTSGLQTDESGRTDTFTIALTSKPSADVTVPVSSSDESEGKVSPASIVFTPTDWNGVHTVTVTGQQDDDQDGPIQYKVVLGAATSTDSSYNGKLPGDVLVTNTDDDTAGITVLGAEGLTTFEPNVPTTYQLKLNTKPTGDVQIALTSEDTGEVTVAQATLKFTADNWNAPQTVTLTGVDDNDVDGPITVKIKSVVTSTDPAYAPITIPDISVVNRDNETAGFFVVPTSGLRTFEDGRRQDQFYVALNTRPSANVVIAVSSSDTGEAVPNVASITFTVDNWNAPKTVRVSGVDDGETDQDQPFTIVLAPAVSTDARFANANPPDVTGVNIDNESANLIVANARLTATEGGSPATFELSLTTAPTANVVIPVSSVTPAQATVAPATVTFTPDNWVSAQRVTVTAVNDSVADGDQDVTIDIGAATSTDGRYGALDPANLTVSVRDNDSPGLNVTPTDLITDESGNTGSFSVSLFTQPAGNVTVPVVSKNTAEITLSTATLTFTHDDWNAPHVVTLTGKDDNLIDGDQLVEIAIGPAAGDAAYVGKTAPSLFATNNDNDVAGATFVLPPGGLVTTENLGTSSFQVALIKPPTADVTFTVSVTKTGEASIDPTTLTFTKDNWAGLQTVTLTGKDDDSVADGDQTFEVVFTPAVSTDTNYDGLVVARLSATNLDNDSPGIVTSVSGGLITGEDGTSDTFEVRLKSKPSTGNTVALQVSTDRPSEGTATPAQLVFNELDWASPRTVVVRGVQDDRVADSDQAYKVLFTASSDDTRYAGLTSSVDVLNIDDDRAGITVTSLHSPLVVREDGSTDTFDVALRSKPTQNVTITVSSTDAGEGVVTPTTLTFTPTDWEGAHTVTVKGQGDLLQDGRQSFFVNFDTIGGDPVYAALSVPTRVPVQNVDTDSAGIEADQLDLTTSEDGVKRGSFRLAIQLPPSADVTIRATSSRTSEGKVSPGAPAPVDIVFTAGPTGISERVVTLYGVDDLIADGDQDYQIVFEPAQSDDPAYAGRIVPALTVRNTDDDSPGILTDVPDPQVALLTVDETTGFTTFSVSLKSRPVGVVRVPLNISRLNEDVALTTPGTSYVEFTNSSWTNATVRLDGINENVQDGNKPFTVELGPITYAPSDANYIGQVYSRILSGVAQDNDTASVTVTARAPNLPTSDLTTGEPNSGDYFDVILGTRPQSEVKINITSSNELEGVVSPATLTFTASPTGPGTYTAPQRVFVTGRDDNVKDGTKTYVINISAPVSDDPFYAALSGSTLTAVNTDNDVPAVTVDQTGTTFTQEAGTTATTFTVKLTTQPSASVFVNLTSLDGQHTVTPTQAVFNATNWSTPVTVTVAAIDDAIDDRDQVDRVEVSAPVSTDADYSVLAPQIVNVLNVDNDTAGFVFAAFSGAVNTVTTYEENTTDTFTVRLNSQPLDNVTLPIAIDATGSSEASVTSQLVFTPQNWATPQLVTVTSINDRVLDGDINGEKPYTVVFAAAQSGIDTDYSTTPQPIAGTSIEAALSCKELLALTTARPTSGTYWLDTDRKGPAPRFRGYCDNDTGTGGWTLLAWTRSSEDEGGVPYPGNDATDLNEPDLTTVPYGSGVPDSAVNALFDTSAEFGQGQTITTTALAGFPAAFRNLKDYEFAGTFNYGDLSGLTRGTTFAGCTGLVTGTYTLITGVDTTAPAPLTNGATVYLNQSLQSSDNASLGDFTSNSYRWSVGNRTGYCATNGTAPASFLGSWQDGQYGPRYPNAAGAYSVWVR